MSISVVFVGAPKEKRDAREARDAPQPPQAPEVINLTGEMPRGDGEVINLISDEELSQPSQGDTPLEPDLTAYEELEGGASEHPEQGDAQVTSSEQPSDARATDPSPDLSRSVIEGRNLERKTPRLEEPRSRRAAQPPQRYTVESPQRSLRLPKTRPDTFTDHQRDAGERAGGLSDGGFDPHADPSLGGAASERAIPLQQDEFRTGRRSRLRRPIGESSDLVLPDGVYELDNLTKIPDKDVQPTLQFFVHKGSSLLLPPPPPLESRSRTI